MRNARNELNPPKKRDCANPCSQNHRHSLPGRRQPHGLYRRRFAGAVAQHRSGPASITGISGTSGGALCAAIAWYGLIQNNPERGAQLLESFWDEMSSRNLPDALSNHFLVWLQRSASFFALPAVSPYQLPNTGQDYLADIIKQHIDFAQLPALVKPSSPRLLVGAVEVLSGQFTVFNSHHEEAEKRITPNALLASAAIPELFRAVKIGPGVYWDGLFSENPPIRSFIAGQQSAEPSRMKSGSSRSIRKDATSSRNWAATSPTGAMNWPAISRSIRNCSLLTRPMNGSTKAGWPPIISNILKSARFP
ncbi:MAG: patatin-like phospholipase family protein [Betaproteobacteria bacterium]|nr:patatin-like phospholipase family protein [Betaproteobacteria bacterium]